MGGSHGSGAGSVQGLNPALVAGEPLLSHAPVLIILTYVFLSAWLYSRWPNLVKQNICKTFSLKNIKVSVSFTAEKTKMNHLIKRLLICNQCKDSQFVMNCTNIKCKLFFLIVMYDMICDKCDSCIYFRNEDCGRQQWIDLAFFKMPKKIENLFLSKRTGLRAGFPSCPQRLVVFTTTPCGQEMRSCQAKPILSCLICPKKGLHVECIRWRSSNKGEHRF